MATVDDIIARVQSSGKITRLDVLEVLEYHKDAAKENENISSFVDAIGGISEENKQKVLNDLNSYPVSYQR